MTFYWLAVFEQFNAMVVPQPPPHSDEVFQMESQPTPHVQMVAEKWTRTGTVNISPGQSTEDVVKNIVTGCKAGEVPDDALLTNIVILPNRLAG